jgi:uncharacterized protein (TIGR02611 family)
MIGRMKGGWQQFKRGRPGHRFQDRYRRNQQSSSGRFSLRKILNIVGGSAIVLAGVFLLAAPGPGWLVLFVGLGMISGELLPVARSLDWAEVRLRWMARKARDLWRASPHVVRVLIIVVLLSCVAALAYGTYYLLFGRSSL